MGWAYGITGVLPGGYTVSGKRGGFREFIVRIFPVIRFSRIKCCHGVVAGHTVFGDKGGDIGFGIFVEQAIMSHAQADDYVQVGVCLVQ